jgi:hypothetical protein
VIEISVINESKLITDRDVIRAVTAVQRQVAEHFYPTWGINCNLTFYDRTQVPPGDAWLIAILDDTTQADYLGYHDQTDEGMPLGKVFVQDAETFGDSWTVTFSHEVLEMLADPDINLCATIETRRDGLILYAYEVCDAVQADAAGYEMDGVRVSNFQLPEWFEAWRRKGSVQFDWVKHTRSPLELLAGGYMLINRVESGQGWEQIEPERPQVHTDAPPATDTVPHALSIFAPGFDPSFARKVKPAEGSSLYRSRPHVGSRRERRRTPRYQWLRSTRFSSSS